MLQNLQESGYGSQLETEQAITPLQTALWGGWDGHDLPCSTFRACAGNVPHLYCILHLSYKQHAVKDFISQAPLQMRTECLQLSACVLWNLWHSLFLGYLKEEFPLLLPIHGWLSPSNQFMSARACLVMLVSSLAKLLRNERANIFQVDTAIYQTKWKDQVRVESSCTHLLERMGLFGKCIFTLISINKNRLNILIENGSVS